jgi:hypothetical protein
MVGSMGQVGSAGDNAAMESFFSLLQKNVLDRQRWATRDELRIAIGTRPVDPRRVRGNHHPADHPGGLTEPVTGSCSRPV